MNVVSLAIWLVVALIVFGIVLIVAKQSGIPVPQWVVNILGLLLLGVVAIGAIIFLSRFATM